VARTVGIQQVSNLPLYHDNTGQCRNGGGPPTIPRAKILTPRSRRLDAANILTMNMTLKEVNPININVSRDI
jgi:hypothetical protein